MSTTMRSHARWCARGGALLLVVLSFGAGGTAFADPGNGQANGQSIENSNAQSNGQGNSPVADLVDDIPGNGNGPAATPGARGNGAGNGASTTASSSRGKSASASASSSSKSDHSRGNAGTSGTWNQKQPLSNADQNSGGANGQCAGGVYCSTRDGTASKNGNNVGKATGRPCAGCVGRADNKNPQGQKPDARRDGNNGYECDGNNGIAKGNPAHTTCQPGTNVVDRCPDGSAIPAGGLSACPKPPPPPPPPPPPLTCPDDQVLVNGQCEEVGGVGGVAPPPAQEPEVLGEEAFAPRPAAEVLGVEATAPAVLPATGSSAGMGLMTGAGFLLLAAGAGLAMRRRVT